jgi:hypothetical protein
MLVRESPQLLLDLNHTLADSTGTRIGTSIALMAIMEVDS